MLRKFRVEIDDREYNVVFEELGVVDRPAAAQAPQVQTPQAAQSPAQQRPAGSTAGISVNSPMPGTILDVRVNVGDRVTKNAVVLILEAMKMENEIVAPKDGTITAIYVQKGDTVNIGAPLVSVE